MTNNEKNQDQELEISMQEKIKAMAKALIVSMAWSGAELLDKKPAQDRQEEEKSTNTFSPLEGENEDKLMDDE